MTDGGHLNDSRRRSPCASFERGELGVRALAIRARACEGAGGAISGSPLLFSPARQPLFDGFAAPHAVYPLRRAFHPVGVSSTLRQDRAVGAYRLCGHRRTSLARIEDIGIRPCAQSIVRPLGNRWQLQDHWHPPIVKPLWVSRGDSFVSSSWPMENFGLFSPSAGSSFSFSCV